MKVGSKVICKVFSEEVGTVYFFDKSSGIVDIKYKGHSGLCSAHESLIEPVKKQTSDEKARIHKNKSNSNRKANCIY